MPGVSQLPDQSDSAIRSWVREKVTKKKKRRKEGNKKICSLDVDAECTAVSCHAVAGLDRCHFFESKKRRGKECM